MIRDGDIDMSGILPADDGPSDKPVPAAAAATTTTKTTTTTKALKTPEIENMPSAIQNKHVRVSTRVSEVLHIARQEIQDGGNDLYKFGGNGTPSSARGTRNSSMTRGVTTLPTL